AFLHHAVSAQLIHEVETVLALAHVKNHAARGSRDLFERGVQLKTGVVDQRTKHIAGHVFGVYANEHRTICLHVAHDHGEVNVAINHVLVRDGAETSVDRRQVSFHDAAHELLFAHAITHQLGDADHFQ